jgi:hypothetical protein
LHAAIAMMDKPAAGQGVAIVKRLLKGVENEPCVSRAADPPADDPTGIGVDHERDVDEAHPGGNIGEVRDPQHCPPSALVRQNERVEEGRISGSS